MTEIGKGLMEDLRKVKKDGEHRCKSKRKACDMLPLEDFMAECLKNKDKITDKEKPSMNTLRHYIPLLVIQLFPAEEQGNKMKVKGMWDNKPEGWPSDIAFKDPNNAKVDPDTGRKGRPTHKTLMDMFMVLFEKYQVQNSGENVGEKVENRNQSVIQSAVLSISALSIPSDCLPIEEKDKPEIINRIKLKIQKMEKNDLVEVDNLSLFHSVEETLIHTYDSNGRQPRFFEVAHDFECLLDCIIECDSKFNPDMQQKWTTFTSEQKNKGFFPQCANALETSERLPTDLSMLNIQAESPNALQALQAGGRLQLRYPANEIWKPNESKSAPQEVFNQESKKFRQQDFDDSEKYINNVMKSSTGSMVSGFGGENNYFSAEVAKGSNAEGVLSQAMLVSGICDTDPGDAIDPVMFTQGPSFSLEDSHDFMYSGNFGMLNSIGVGEMYDTMKDLDVVDLVENLGGDFTVASYESVTATETIIDPPDLQESENQGEPLKLNQYQFPSDSQKHPNENMAVVVENKMNGSHPTVSVMISGEPDSVIENEELVTTHESEVNPQEEEDMDTDDL